MYVVQFIAEIHVVNNWTPIAKYHHNGSRVYAHLKINAESGKARSLFRAKFLEEIISTCTCTCKHRTDHEEGGVGHSPGGRYDLSSSPVDGLTSDNCIKNLELDVANGCT